MKPCDYITKVMTVHNLHSRSAAAELIGISRQAVTNYYKSDTQKGFDDYVAIRVATLLDLDPISVIADMNLQRAKTPEVKRFWKKIASTAAALLFSLSLFSYPNDSVADSERSKILPAIYYAPFTLPWLLCPNIVFWVTSSDYFNCIVQAICE